MSRRRKGRRLAVSMALMTLALGAIIARLLFVQGINAGMYQADARSEYVHQESRSWENEEPSWTAMAMS